MCAKRSVVRVRARDRYDSLFFPCYEARARAQTLNLQSKSVIMRANKKIDLRLLQLICRNSSHDGQSTLERALARLSARARGINEKMLAPSRVTRARALAGPLAHLLAARIARLCEITFGNRIELPDGI